MTTAAQRHKLNRRPIRDPYIALVEVTDEVMGTVHRAAANNEDIVSNGETFVRSDISVVFPKSGDEETSASLEMSNVSRIAGRAVEAAIGRIGVRLMLVDASDPDTIVKVDTLNLLVAEELTVTSETVSASLSPRAKLNEQYPPRTIDESGFPGAYFS